MRPLHVTCVVDQIASTLHPSSFLPPSLHPPSLLSPYTLPPSFLTPFLPPSLHPSSLLPYILPPSFLTPSLPPSLHPSSLLPYTLPPSFPCPLSPYLFSSFLHSSPCISSPPPDHADCKQAVDWVCQYIEHQARKEHPQHSRDLHTSIVAAFRTLLTLITLHPYLLGDKVPHLPR